MAVRAALLLGVALALLAATGALAAEQAASWQRLQVTALLAVLAPLFWPGCAPGPSATAWRVLGWSALASAVAVLALALPGGPRQPVAAVLAVGALLLALLLLVHALLAALETRWCQAGCARPVARERAGRVVTGLLLLAGTLPLWLGPAAEGLSRTQPWALDAVVGASPLTHLAVLSGNDLLRNDWLYQHSNLAALAVDYPGPATLAGAYLLALALLAAAVLVRRGRRDRSRFTSEKPS
jgi:hypothetical protein